MISHEEHDHGCVLKIDFESKIPENVMNTYRSAYLLEIIPITIEGSSKLRNQVFLAVHSMMTAKSEVIVPKTRWRHVWSLKETPQEQLRHSLDSKCPKNNLGDEND